MNNGSIQQSIFINVQMAVFRIALGNNVSSVLAAPVGKTFRSHPGKSRTFKSTICTKRVLFLSHPPCAGCGQQGGAHLGRLHRPEEVLPRGPGGHDRRLRGRQGSRGGRQQGLLPEGEATERRQPQPPPHSLLIGSSRAPVSSPLLRSPPRAAFRDRWCSWSRR